MTVNLADLTSAGTAGNAAQEAHDEADRVFGATLREAIAVAHGADIALAVRRAFTQATRPGTAARAQQDRFHALITARLGKIAGEVP